MSQRPLAASPQVQLLPHAEMRPCMTLTAACEEARRQAPSLVKLVHCDCLLCNHMD
jgi:hypothetical protein